jgi:membrane protein YdbS with pleckstrin-like domain
VSKKDSCVGIKSLSVTVTGTVTWFEYSEYLVLLLVLVLVLVLVHSAFKQGCHIASIEHEFTFC